MPYLVRLGPYVVAYVSDEKSVINPSLAFSIEPCLLRYGATIYLGAEEETPFLRGYRIGGLPPNVLAEAIKICIAFHVHREAKVTSEAIYAVEAPRKAGGGGEGEDASKLGVEEI